MRGRSILHSAAVNTSRMESLNEMWERRDEQTERYSMFSLLLKTPDWSNSCGKETSKIYIDSKTLLGERSRVLVRRRGCRNSDPLFRKVWAMLAKRSIMTARNVSSSRCLDSTGFMSR